MIPQYANLVAYIHQLMNNRKVLPMNTRAIKLFVFTCVFAMGVVADAAPDTVITRSDQARFFKEKPGTEFGDILRFIPRLVLAPPKYVFKGLFYGIRHAGIFVEKNALIDKTIDLLFNDARTAAILPTATFSSEYGRKGGVTLFHKDLFKNKERLQFEAQYGSEVNQSYDLSFNGDYFLGSSFWIDSNIRFARNASLRFAGIGNRDGGRDGHTMLPRTTNVLTRYSEEVTRGYLRGGYGFGKNGRIPKFKFGGSVIYNHQDFDNKRRGRHDDPSIHEVYDIFKIVGFEDVVETMEFSGDFEMNLLNYQGRPSRGTHLYVFAGGVPKTDDYRYWHYGFEQKTYFNLYRDDRVFLFRTLIEAVHGEDDNIPFSSLPTLGGVNRLRGYERGMFRDRIAGTATFEYRFPIHQYISGAAFIEMGTVARKYSNFARKWRRGWGGGLIFGGKRNLLFKADFSYGDFGTEIFISMAPRTLFSSGGSRK